MTDRFVDPAVAGERFERLRIVVERSALAKHEARIGRVEEVLVEGPSKTRPDRHERAHPPEQARPLRRPPVPSGRARTSPSRSPARPRTILVARFVDVVAPATPRHPHPGRRRCRDHAGHAATTASDRRSSGRPRAASPRSRTPPHARRPDIELISVDAMQVYRGMDIGTAKPTAAERTRGAAPLASTSSTRARTFTVADFVAADDAASARRSTRAATRPLLVGGTGLYLRAITDRSTSPAAGRTLRAELEADAEVAALYDRLARRSTRSAAARIEPTNQRRIVRALEVCVGSGRPFSSFGPGLDVYRDRRRRCRSACAGTAPCWPRASSSVSTR